MKYIRTSCLILNHTLTYQISNIRSRIKSSNIYYRIHLFYPESKHILSNSHYPASYQICTSIRLKYTMRSSDHTMQLVDTGRLKVLLGRLTLESETSQLLYLRNNLHKKIVFKIWSIKKHIFILINVILLLNEIMPYIK